MMCYFSLMNKIKKKKPSSDAVHYACPVEERGEVERLGCAKPLKLGGRQTPVSNVPRTLAATWLPPRWWLVPLQPRRYAAMTSTRATWATSLHTSRPQNPAWPHARWRFTAPPSQVTKSPFWKHQMSFEEKKEHFSLLFSILRDFTVLYQFGKNGRS